VLGTARTGQAARTVFEVIDEAVQDGVMLKVAGSLPDDIAELVTGGSAD
jgi:uncharacterized protein (DUF2267 family)